MGNKKLNILLMLLFLNMLLSVVYADENEIILDGKDKEEKLGEIKDSKIFYIKGSVDTAQQFMELFAYYEKDPGLSPDLYVTKASNFSSEEQSYDYSSESESENNKLIIPTTYFGSDGFYLHVVCKDECSSDLSLSILLGNILKVKGGEKISFFAKSENYSALNVEVDWGTALGENQQHGYLLIGDDSGLSMKVNDKRSRKKFPNVFVYTDKSEETQNTVVLTVQEGNKFTFLTQIIDTANPDKKTIYENEYNQYFIVTGEVEQCFDVSSKDTDDKTDRGVTVIGQKSFSVNVTCGDDKSTLNEVEAINEIDYTSSPQYTCTGTKVKSVCVKSSQKNQSVMRITVSKIFYSNTEATIKKKMPEPLARGIYQQFELESVGKTNNMNVHSYDVFFHSDKEYYGTKGADIDLEILSGDVKVYKYLCKSYPYCNVYNDDLDKLIQEESTTSALESLYRVSNHVATSIFSSDEKNTNSNFRYIIIVKCEENDNKCLYKIGHYNTQDHKNLLDGGSMVKYLGYYKENENYIKQDAYTVFLHEGSKKLIVDLFVYSGDAFINDADDELCTFTSHKIGSNERRVYICPDEVTITNYRTLDFNVQANGDGAVYLVMVNEKEADDLGSKYPVGVTVMETIQVLSRNFTIHGVSSDNSKYSSYYTSFLPLSCDLKISNSAFKDSIKTTNEDVTIHNYDVQESVNSFDYEIEQENIEHIQNKYCIYSVSSNYPKDDDSFLLLPEAKPFRVKLNNNNKVVRVMFPYASAFDKPKVYLRITMYEHFPVKVVIQAGFGNEKEYYLTYSKDILVISKDYSSFRYKTVCPIKITVYYLSDDDVNQNVIDFNIKSLAKIPYSIKAEEHFTDFVLNNGIQYYLAFVSQNSRGAILTNFKRGTGEIYGRLFSYGQTKEIGGWNNRIQLPDKDTRNLLKFDFYDQKLSFDESDTGNCEGFCYLVFGIKQREEFQTNEDVSSSYSLFFRYFDQEESNGNFVDLQNDEFVYGGISNDQNDYFKYKIEHDTAVLIDFKSEYCKLTLAFGTQDFTSETSSKIYKSHGDTTLIRLSKEEIIKYYSSATSIKGQVINIKIDAAVDDKNIDIDKLDIKYKLRVNSPLSLLENVTTIDTSQPIYCDTSDTEKNKEFYCDYVVNLDTFEDFKTIEFIGSSFTHSDLEIYANIISSSDFAKNIIKGNLPSWPDKDIKQFPNENHTAMNLLVIRKKQFPDYSVDDVPKLLVRVYSKEKGAMELLTNLAGYQTTLSPLPKYYQFLSVRTNTSTILDLPPDYSYNIHFISIDGVGSIFFNGQEYEIYGDYASIVLNTQKHVAQTVKILANGYNLDYEYDSNFRLFVWYSKSLSDRNMEKLSVGSGGEFLYQKFQLPFGYYFKVSDDTRDIPFNIIFRKLQTEHDQTDPRDKNATELFDIKGYLISEEELLKIQMNTDYSTLKDPVNGNYEFSHHQGTVYFDSEIINSTVSKKNLKFPLYAFILVDKSKVNNREYTFIHSTISVFPFNDLERSTPSNIYIANRFKPHDKLERHIYKLSGLSSTDEDIRKMYIEFSTIDTNVKVKFIEDIKNIDEETSKDFDNKHATTLEMYGVEVNVLQKDIGKAIMVIECPKSDHIVDYIFRYRAEIKSLARYRTNTLVGYTKLTKHRVNLNISRVFFDEDNKLADSNYYIRIFKYSDLLGNSPISTSFRQEPPYAVYKIAYNDELMDKKSKFVNIEMEIDLVKDYYIDIVAEILDYEELYEYIGYKRFFPKDPVKKKKDYSKLFYGALIASILLFALVVGTFIALYSYKKKNEDLQQKVQSISFRLSKEDENNKNNYLTGETEENDNEKNQLN